MRSKSFTCLGAVLAIFLIVLGATACSAGLEEQIIGQWENANTDEESDVKYSFREDGNVLIWTDELVVAGTYLWLDEDTILMTIMGGDTTQEIVGDIKIEGNRMMISSEAGEVQILERVK